MSHRVSLQVEDLTEKAVVAEKATMGRKGEILEQLEGITPVLEAAKKAVGSIRSDHLAEIRSLSMPPEPIVDVLSAVLRLLGIQDTSWLSMKKVSVATSLPLPSTSYLYLLPPTSYLLLPASTSTSTSTLRLLPPLLCAHTLPPSTRSRGHSSWATGV